jgi:hypothetical protein
MNKFAIAVIFTIMVSSFALTLDEAKNMINQDSCATKIMDLLAPEIEAKVAEVKNNPNNQQAKDELSALIEKSKNTYEKCQGNLRAAPVLSDPIKAAGVGFLLASNCFKDVGIVLLIADSIVQDPTDYTNDVIVAIFLYILGRQGYADCEQLIHYLHL